MNVLLKNIQQRLDDQLHPISYVTHLLQNYKETKDQVLVSQQLGQKGTSATDLYTHIGQSKQKEALNKIK